MTPANDQKHSGNLKSPAKKTPPPNITTSKAKYFVVAKLRSRVGICTWITPEWTGSKSSGNLANIKKKQGKEINAEDCLEKLQG